jgi:hypothetical protein
LNETLWGEQASIQLTEECDVYKITLKVTDGEGSYDIREQEITTRPYNNTVRAYPQVIMAGVSPSQVDNRDTEFDVIAIVRPGLSPIRHVSFQDTVGTLNIGMARVGVLPNGDEVYQHTYSIVPGSLNGIFETAWGSKPGQFNIIATGESSYQSHTFPFLRVSHLERINDSQPAGVKQQPAPITYKRTVREGPQMIMAGYSPAILHIGDDQFDLLAIVRAGELPIENVTLKNNSTNQFDYTMRFAGELENDDKVYKATFYYEPGALGMPGEDEYLAHKDLWGPSAEQFRVVVYDLGRKHNHKFPDIHFGPHPKWDGNYPSSCESIR